MATAQREELARSYLAQASALRSGRQPTKHESSPPRSHRQKHGPRRLRPVQPSEEALQQREQGWNGRFFYEPPINSNKLPRPDRDESSSHHSPVAKERKIREERAQYGKGDTKRKAGSKQKPNNSKLVPLGSLVHPPSETTDSTKEEKLRFKVLKIIDARETLLYQLSALILCTPVQESLFMPSRPTEPPRSMGSGRQQIRPKAGMALAPTPIAGKSGGAMTNAREAAKLAQKLATDLQEVGIQCVESLVEWMLEAGAKAEKPPPFLWRGRNYFLKMNSDLDFAEAELQARGVHLDCFSSKNPLLIRPSQKLGRVLAAQSIINEMIEMNKEPTPQEIVALSSPDQRDGNTDRDGTELTRVNDKQGMSAPEHMDSCTRSDVLLKVDRDEHSGGKVDDASGSVDSQDDDGYGEDQMSSVGNNDDNGNLSAGVLIRDPETEVELVSMLDESLSNLPHFRSRVYDEAADRTINSARTDTSSQSEYNDNNFDDEDNTGEYANEFGARDGGPDGAKVYAVATADLQDDGEENDDKSTPEEASLRSNAYEEPQSKQSAEPTTILHSEEPDLISPICCPPSSEITAPGDSVHTNSEGKFHPQDPTTFLADEFSEPQQGTSSETLISTPVQAEIEKPDMYSADVESYSGMLADDSDAELSLSGTCDPLSNPPAPQVLLDELEKWAPESEAREAIASLPESFVWQDAEALESSMRDHASLVPSLQSSLTWVLVHCQLIPPSSPLVGFLNSSAAESLAVRLLLWNECNHVLSIVCRVLASQVLKALEKENPLVSEIDMGDVIEMAEAVFRSHDDSVWRYIGVVTSLLCLPELTGAVNCSETSGVNSSAGKCGCPGLSELVQVFYPYLVNQPRDKLRDQWGVMTHLLTRHSLRLDKLAFLLDPVLKGLVLVVSSLDVRAGGSSSRSIDDSDRDALLIPKLAIVCERGDILRSSIDAVWTKHLSSKDAPQHVMLYPFFRSPYGEKVVDNVRVEEGEGKGPLKEWFALVGENLAAKWRQIEVDLSFARDSADGDIVANGNRLVVPHSVSHLIRPGFQVEWEDSMNVGETVVRVVNKEDPVSRDTFLLDRAVSSQSFPVSTLRLAEPCTPIFDYIRASESYSLNALTADTAENRRTFTFVGWLLATTITHSCTIRLRLHHLIFSLLLNPDYRVTLRDLKEFDPVLLKSLEQIKTMPKTDLAALLELEEVDPSFTAEEYISHTLESTFGSSSSLAWQLDAIRQGFERVISVGVATRLGLSGRDMAALVCGDSCSTGISDSTDFQIDLVFRVAADPDFAACAPLSRGFWRTVNKFDPSLKRKLVKFITGVDTLPVPGTEFLRIEMPFPALSAADHAKSFHMLPQAHTCDNTIELPHYWKALCWHRHHGEHMATGEAEAALEELLEVKLRTAIECSEGYGLDGTVAVAGIIPGTTRDPYGGDDGGDKEESYESLDVPALQSGDGAREDCTPEANVHEKLLALSGSGDAVTRAGDEGSDKPPSPLRPLLSSSLGEDSQREGIASPGGHEESYEENDWEDEELV